MTDLEYVEAIKKMAADHQRELIEHGAIDSVAGSNFYGYVIKESDGYALDVWSWGSHHGKHIRSDSIEDLKRQGYATYDQT